MQELYRNIKRLREENGLSQEALAKLTGYTDRSSITKIEKGQVDLQQSKIELFAKALNTSVPQLVGWEEYTPPKKNESPKILQYYNLLNDIGKHEATKRVMELTEIPRYVQKDTELAQPHTIAAHFDGDEFTQDELEKIAEFEDFVKNRKK